MNKTFTPNAPTPEELEAIEAQQAEDEALQAQGVTDAELDAILYMETGMGYND